MKEIELKFQIPESALPSLQADLRQLPGGDRPLQRLQAVYFDTPERHLARARAALRIRREDDDWVQTLKAQAVHAIERLEDNQPYPAPADPAPLRPRLDLHQGDVRAALQRDLGWQPATDATGAHCGLVALYETDMQRLRAQQALPDGPAAGEVELALDLGEIRAGHLSQPVRELEIELLRGSLPTLTAIARPFVQRHGLWLDMQSKAHRGDALAKQAAGQPATAAKALPTPSDTTVTLRDVAAWLECLTRLAHGGSDAERAATLDWLRHWAACLPAHADTALTLADALANTRDTRGWAQQPGPTLLSLDLLEHGR